MEYNYKKIGERIRAERRKLGLSQENMIEKIRESDGQCFGRNVLSRMENGDPAAFGAVTFSQIQSLCDLFKCDISYLIGECTFRNRDREFISQQTGLTESSIKTLEHWNRTAQMRGIQYSWSRKSLFAINALLEQDAYFFNDVLIPICDYLRARWLYDNPGTGSMNAKKHYDVMKDMRSFLFAVTDGISSCVKEIYKKHTKKGH